MPKRRRKSSRHRDLSKLRHTIIRWRTVLLVFYVLSIILIFEMIYSLTHPSNYPTKNLKDITPLRSTSLPESVRVEAHAMGFDFSSVEFVECPVNSRQRYEASLNSMSEVECKWVCEVYLTENATFEWVNTTFLSFEKVIDFRVFLDGKSCNYYLSEYDGQRYYIIPGFNLTKKNDIRKYEIYFKIKRTAYPNDYSRKPWLFNEKYAQFINFPMGYIPVQTGKESDLNTFKVNLGLPFRRILVDQSGWMDAFVPPRSEWDGIHCFEYPIEQETETDGNTYFFKTYFSENNIANLPKIILVPNWNIPLLLVLFLGSPFHIPFLHG